MDFGFPLSVALAVACAGAGPEGGPLALTPKSSLYALKCVGLMESVAAAVAEGLVNEPFITSFTSASFKSCSIHFMWYGSHSPSGSVVDGGASAGTFGMLQMLTERLWSGELDLDRDLSGTGGFSVVTPCTE